MIRVSKMFYIGWSKCYSMFNPICLLFCPDTKVIAHCRFQIILYSYQIFITSSNSIYKLVSNTIICNIWVWRVQLIDEQEFSHSPDLGVVWLLHCQDWQFRTPTLVVVVAHLAHRAAGSAQHMHILMVSRLDFSIVIIYTNMSFCLTQVIYFRQAGLSSVPAHPGMGAV